MDKEKEAERRGRTQGVVWAASWLAKHHDLPTIAKEMLDLWGTDIIDACKTGCDAGDVVALKEARVW